MLRISLSLLLALVLTVPATAQNKNSASLQKLLNREGSTFLKYVLDNPATYQYQLIYTRIDRNKKNKLQFHNQYFGVDTSRYFNPASTVKVPVAALALEKLYSLKQYGVDMNSIMVTDSSYSAQSAVGVDSSAENLKPSLRHYIKKLLLVSDNDAYNRLYEFVGQETINKRLWEMGYSGTRITRRFVTMNEDENRHTNQIRFFDANGKLLYTQPPAYSDLKFDFSKKVLFGRAHYNRNDSLINAPMDFTTHNNFPLPDFQQIVQSVLYPESVDEKKRFHLDEKDLQLLRTYMSELPAESLYPKYDTTEYFDSYTKFFFFKYGKGKIPGYIRSFNKTGWSYGFLIDAAYIVDVKNNVDFMLSGVIYVNSDGVLNDNKYEYDDIGYRFFKEVGEIIYKQELKRKRKHTPDLSEFKLIYN